MGNNHPGKRQEEINQIWKEQNLVDVNTVSFLDFYLEFWVVVKTLNETLKTSNYFMILIPSWFTFEIKTSKLIPVFL